MIIKNGHIFTEEGKFQKGHILILNSQIEKITYDERCLEEYGETIIDAEKMYVLPGLVDIHFHGCAGYDFCDASFEALEQMEKYQLENGITSLFPATMTLSKEELQTIFQTALKYKKTREKTSIQGITMEGPFISKAKKGAQNELHIQKPDIEFFEKMQELSGGFIRQVVVAPEEDKNLDFIFNASPKVTVSVAHTGADYETAEKAFAKGATHVTHLFNGMNPFSHREPGVVGAAYDNKHIFVELICDGVHIHPSMIRAVFELFGAERICMISDSMRATGMTEGEYTLGGQKVFVKENKATLEDGTIAGSICNLYQCLKKAVLEMNIPLESAVLSCTKTPAKSLGVDKECGILLENRAADLLILDKNLEIKYVIKNGQIVSR